MYQSKILNSQHVDRLLRHPVELSASIRRATGPRCDTVVRDLSLDGCCVIGFFHKGDEFKIHIEPIGVFQAQVRWASMGRAGLKFLRDQLNFVQPRSLARDDAGVAVIEYALLIALIALAIVVSLSNTGDGVGNNWNEVNTAMTTASGTDYNSN